MKKERKMIEEEVKRMRESLDEGKEVLRLALGRFLSRDADITPTDGNEKKRILTRM